MTETRQHREVKQLVARAAADLGWTAQFEVAEVSPSGKRWIADCLLEKGTRRIAFEVQWSSQSEKQYLARQALYADSGVEVIWLHRNVALKPRPDLKEGHLHESHGDYAVRLDGVPGQEMSVEGFTRAALENRLRFGLRATDPMNVCVMAATVECWRDNCTCRYPMIPALLYSIGNSAYSDPANSNHSISLEQFGRDPESEKRLLSVLHGLGGWEHVRQTFSKTVGDSYLACSCPECGALLGAFFAIQHAYDAKPVVTFEAPITPLLLEEHLESLDDVQSWFVW